MPLPVDPKVSRRVLASASASPIVWIEEAGDATMMKGDCVARLTGANALTTIGLIPTAYDPTDIAFSADGSYLYIGNFLDQDMSVLKVDGDKITDTGARFKLPGHPASMRAGPQ